MRINQIIAAISGYSGLFIILLLTALLSSLIFADNKLKYLINNSKTAVVEIFNYGPDGKKYGQGTGFFINSKGYIATNLHVVLDAADISVKTSAGEEYRIDKVINTSAESDIVIFSVKGVESRKYYLPVIYGKAEVGDEVIVIGNPMGLEQTVSNGIVSAVRDFPEYGQVYQITAPVSPGLSGSPVINSSGDVVGIATMVYKEGQNLNFIVPGYKLLGLLKNPDKIMAFNFWRKDGVGYMPSTSDGLLRLGFIYYNSKEYNKALECASLIMKKDPKFAKGWYLAGKSAFEAGNHDYAVKSLQYASSLDPEMADVHNDLGIMYEKMDMIPDATEEYFREIDKHPENPDPYYNLATVYEESGSIDDAVEIIKQGLIKCENTSELHARLGFLYISLKDITSALPEFNTAISLDKSNPEAYYGLGIAYMKNGQKDEAIKIYYKLKQLDEKEAEKLFAVIYS